MAQSDPIVEDLWNQDVTPENYGSKEQYFQHIFDQYKTFVEMADQISTRRNLANTFFLTVHTLIISVVGIAYENNYIIANDWFILFPLVAVLALCYVWRRLLHSYRQINAAKYKVIGEYERRLPSSPYWEAEWKVLGEGKDPRLYYPLTDIEKWIPLLFALLYVVGAGIVILP